MPGIPLAPLADVEQLQLGLVGQPPSSSSAGTRAVWVAGWRSWRQLVIPPASRPAMLRTPTASASLAARRESASSRPINTISWS